MEQQIQEIQDGKILKKIIEKKHLILIVSLVCIATLIFSLIMLILKEEKDVAHEKLAENYVNAFITDNPEKQFEMLDMACLECQNKNFEDFFKNYKREPMVKKYYSVDIEFVKQAGDKTLQKINNVYSAFCQANDIKKISVDKAYRYEVCVNNTKHNHNMHEVAFWIVETEGELKVCTLFEYDRSLDRCAQLDIY